MHELSSDRAREAIAKQWRWHHRIEGAPGVVTPGPQTWTVEKSASMGRSE